MGLTQKLGTIPLAIQTDSSNNVGIGGAANASYKLAVTGASLFSSSVTAGARVSGITQNSLEQFNAGGLTAFSNGNAFRYIQIGYDNAGNYGWIQSLEQGTAYRNLILNGAGGNVGIGTSSPAEKLDVIGGAVAAGNGTIRTGITYSSLGLIGTFTNHDLGILTNGTERMRITSGGRLLVGTSSVISGSYSVQASGIAGFVTNGTGSGDANYYSVSSTIAWHFYAESSGATKFYVLNNGDVKNANNSYGAISDISLKENITDATPKLADLLKVKVRNYNLIADEKKEKQLGVIAQELEEIFPNMISEDIQMGSEEKIKTVKYSVFVPMLIKAIQELNEKVTALENK